MRAWRDIYSVCYGLPYFQEFVKVPLGSICQEHVCHLKNPKSNHQKYNPLKVAIFRLFPQPTFPVGVGRSPFWSRFPTWLRYPKDVSVSFAFSERLETGSSFRLERSSPLTRVFSLSLNSEYVKVYFWAFMNYFSSLPASLLLLNLTKYIFNLFMSLCTTRTE